LGVQTLELRQSESGTQQSGDIAATFSNLATLEVAMNKLPAARKHMEVSVAMCVSPPLHASHLNWNVVLA